MKKDLYEGETIHVQNADFMIIGSGSPESGRFRFRVPVFGYWSSDPISAYIERDYYYNDDVKVANWKISVSHSSGGRDSNDTEMDTEASRCFGKALSSLCDFLEGFVTNAPAWEEAYQAKVRAREKARQDAIDADEAFDKDSAESFISIITTMVKADKSPQTIHTFRRGTDQYDNKIIVVSLTPTGRVRYQVRRGDRLTVCKLDEAIDLLVGTSSRTYRKFKKI